MSLVSLFKSHANIVCEINISNFKSFGKKHIHASVALKTPEIGEITLESKINCEMDEFPFESLIEDLYRKYQRLQRSTI